MYWLDTKNTQNWKRPLIIITDMFLKKQHVCDQFQDTETSRYQWCLFPTFYDQTLW